MEILIFFLIYTVGCIFSYYRWIGYVYELDEKWYSEFGIPTFPRIDPVLMWIVILTSWFGFIAGTVAYFIDNHKYFFKKKQL